MFGKSITLFSLLGFKVKVDLSWAFLALLIAWSLAEGYFPGLYEGLPTVTYWWMGVAGVAGLFLSIILHELAHSLVARQYGLPIGGITLFIFGGVAEMEEEPVSPKVEFLMAIAGPIASIIISVAFYALAIAGQTFGASPLIVAVAQYLSLLNMILAIFNMVPAFPLDGGRMLRAVLWWRKGSLRGATRAASRMGTGFGWLLIGLGLLSALSGNIVGGIWWFLIGLFVQGIAKASYVQLVAQQTLGGETVRHFMTEMPVTVSPTISVAELVGDYVYRYAFDLFPVVENGQLVGAVTTGLVKDIPREKWNHVRVGDIAFAPNETNTISADEDAGRALTHMQRSGNSRLMVVDSGQLVGIISLKDMLRRLTVTMELEGER